MSTTMTPAERYEAMNALPHHALYMTRGGGHALITQSFCELVSQTEHATVIKTVGGERSIPAADLFALKTDGRLTDDEVASVFAEHGREQKGF